MADAQAVRVRQYSRIGFPHFNKMFGRAERGKRSMSESTQKPKENPKGSHTAEEWQRKFYAMDGKCHYCGVALAFSQATKDHRTPKCRGGSDKIWNIVPACLRCNQMKGWRTEAEFIAARPGLCTNAQPRLTKDKPKPLRKADLARNYELINNPFLLEELRKESESVSWAWRNPA